MGGEAFTLQPSSIVFDRVNFFADTRVYSRSASPHMVLRRAHPASSVRASEQARQAFSN
jgi:hypothetical protein